MTGDLLLLLLVVGVPLLLLVLNPVNWVRVAIRLVPKDLRAALVEKMLHLAIFNEPGQALLMTIVVRRAARAEHISISENSPDERISE